MRVEQEVAGGDPLPRHGFRLVAVEAVVDQQLSDSLAGSFRVGLQQVEGTDRWSERSEIVPVARGGLDQALGDWNEECPGAARGLDENLATEIAVGGVADEIKDQFDDPTSGEDFAIVGAGIGGEFSEGHRVLEQGELPGQRHGIRLSRT